jgi:hypothetical protein
VTAAEGEGEAEADIGGKVGGKKKKEKQTS